MTLSVLYSPCSNVILCINLKEYENAKARGANVYCELIGYGMSGKLCSWRSMLPCNHCMMSSDVSLCIRRCYGHC